MRLTKKNRLVILKFIESSDNWYSFRFTDETASAIDAWIAALRSGIYAQGRYKLYNLKTKNYCSLGVLRKSSSQKLRKHRYHEFIVEEDFNNCLHIVENRRVQHFFIYLNDGLEYSFKTIAAILENLAKFIESDEEYRRI